MFDLSNLRKASTVPFPYGVPKKDPYVFLGNDCVIVPISGKEQARNYLAKARAGEGMVIAGWVGQYRTDMFHIDDLDRWEFSMLTERERVALQR